MIGTGFAPAAVVSEGGGWTILRAGTMYAASRSPDRTADYLWIDRRWAPGVRRGGVWTIDPAAEWAFPAYSWNSAEPFGNVWDARMPPGLPPCRPCSVAEAATSAIRAESADFPVEFRATILALGRHESHGARYAIPADRYDDAGPGGRPKITAWGCFQFNQGAWDRIADAIDELGRWGAPVVVRGPVWRVTPAEEIRAPVAHYKAVWRATQDAGADAWNCSLAIWLFHSGPGYWRAFVRSGRRNGWRNALWGLPSEFPRDPAAAAERGRKADEESREAWRAGP